MTVRVSDAATGHVIKVFTGHRMPVTALTLFNEQRIVSGDAGGAAYMWDLRDAPPRALVGHRATVAAIAVHPGTNRILTAGWDLTARLWDGHTGDMVASFEHPARVTGAAFGADGQFITTCSDNRVRVWTPDQSEPVRTQPGRPVSFESSQIDPLGTKLVMVGGPVSDPGGGGIARLWDLNGGAAGANELSLPRKPATAVIATAISPDGLLAAVATADTTVEIWELPTRTLRHTFRGHTMPVSSVIFTPPSSRRQLLATEARDGTGKIWDP